VDGQRSRYVGAAAVDVLFAALYGALALAIARPARLSRIGAWSVVVGAGFDQMESDRAGRPD
jgi:hypothetical protein